MVVGERTGRWVPANARAWRERWRAAPTAARDAVLALALAGAAWVPGLAQQGIAFAELPAQRDGVLRVVLVLAQSLPLVARRTAPAATLGVVGLAFAVDQAVGHTPTIASLGLLVALYGAGAYEVRHRLALGVSVAVAYGLLCVVVHRRGSPARALDLASFALVLALCWGAGAWARSRAAAESERRRREAAEAVVEERVRLARELHDVVTHHVTAIVVQADAAQVVLRSATPAADDAAGGRVGATFEAISGTGREALAELRQLLGLLHAGSGAGAPPAGPGLAGLGDLVASARAAGRQVDVVVDEMAGETGSRLGPAAQLAVYRVAQEGLTNAAKHAPGSRTTVRLRVDDEAVLIEVVSHAPATGEDVGPAGEPDRPVAGAGRGVAGLRARVVELGGELTARPTSGGGFLLAARVPAKTPVGPPGRTAPGTSFQRGPTGSTIPS